MAKSWVPKDQTIPTDIARRIVRRDGTPPEVMALTLDVNFGAIDASKSVLLHIPHESLSNRKIELAQFVLP